jgi:ATP-dependent protease Clp ATPase subunit
MYDLPSESDVEKVIVTAAFVKGEEDIKIIRKTAGELPSPT